MKFYEYLCDKYEKNELITVDDIKFNNLSREAIRHRLDRLVKKELLRKKCSNMYYIPKISEFTGRECAFPTKELFEKKYISDGENVYGYYGGLYLINYFGLTTQCALTRLIITNKEKHINREVWICGHKALLKRPYVEINKDNVEYLEALELLRSANDEEYEEYFSKIAEYFMVKDFDKQMMRSYVKHYPNKVIKRYMEVEDEIAS